jgi:MoaA/NifB/PqqE/SkfB family radical SAM enzyme
MTEIYIPPKVAKAKVDLPPNPAIAVDSDDKTFMVIWSWGLRCNFDCTYCSPERHNNTSKHTEKERLLKAVNFLYEYREMLSQYIKHDYWYISITGGEPTANPYFVDTMKALKERAPDFKLDVTTNGSFSTKIRDAIIPVIDHMTVSYHAESDDKIKTRVKENILFLQNSRVRLKVNLMMHAYEYWDECVALAEELTANGVNVVPRIIGESLEDNPFNHKYSVEQMTWMKEYWKAYGNKVARQPNVEQNRKPKPRWDKQLIKVDKEQLGICACDEGIQQPAEPYAPDRENLDVSAEDSFDSSKLAKANLGRYCCGKRDMIQLGGETAEWSTSKLVNHTQFKYWHCLINYYFLYIDQEFDQVWHHQTCKANWREGRGKMRDPHKLNGVDEQSPIGKITEYEKILENFKSKIYNGKIPIIQCPRTTCGCGVCIPKAKDSIVADKIFKKHITGLKPAWSKPLLKDNK